MIRAAIALIVMAFPALASAPEVSVRPVARPAIAVARAAAPTVATSPIPQGRPDAAAPAGREPQAPLALSAGPGPCGVAGIDAVAIEPVRGEIAACGIAEPVRVQAVSGVRLDRPARMDCTTAKALKSWVDQGVRPVLPNVVSLKVAAGYACRTRNNQAGAKVSEHGKGRAIDISAFRMANGAELTVLDGWRSARTRPLLERMHAAACGPFGTVLGPRADRFHQDHFHLDTARYRSGSYCR